ncbi:uncharacterized protein OCT59_005022 [Rhizophagus irregularis]|uniref:Btb/poz domain-containing protein 19-like n=2 Tax=Rhizophagus irregularis TaxID=588596 RepID=A0A015LW91_RHIIW|nr:hypothetical protein GLOIN_2v1766025 [Rhizophagus irregularis DAOM 181602=DAOM 197198]EXX76981.1 hypothetical protein RirG_027990 [Rhizophagus irregularis DAOM 197198w]POG78985.1 hypothetical protein GLOIN_2v1766025 [Rhizophagus irregularis DAOM 181602=DAOM 197198]UZO13524.1 hypothetical protein OCT59_005022 [Rhizophagus irregularis]GBC21474.1 hypothetical protein GLOIN_2v1766025 [Rhizophagus irregularis DAOM 181602=DAOM 197198]|eukprot:XP_025185851.1 hypothetical protein GLOIN_2v1766025 [Rhizophagus irregularis DAOM 181602=DAOM 197198]
MTSKFWAELSSDYEKLFETEIGYDVIIYSGEEPNVKEIHAHSNILCIRSQYFRSVFSNEWAEKKDGKFILKKPNISPHLFNIILRFIYCGNIELKNLQGPEVLKLLIAVDELNIQQLITYIQEYLIEHQTEFLHQNPTGILETVYQHETFTDLWEFCLEKICEEPEILFNSDKFIDLKAPLLEMLIKRDDLNMEEIEIWEGLLKWCFAQQNMINDPTKWSKDDITKIERSLHRFIPLVRFYDINPADFFYKVYCYKEILPQDLIHNLLEFHIVPNMKPKTNVAPSRKPNLKFKIDSTLIESNHIPLFASWIDRKDSPHKKNDIPYELKLLYRSSRDGFDAASFHRNCDNKGATIWIAKIQGTTQLIGGYNPLDWCGYGWKSTTDSFLFHITDGKNISTAKLSYVNNNNAVNAIYCHGSQGPQMGDFLCSGFNKWYFYDAGVCIIYPKIGIPESFMVENYEVFQVIKK